jgi:hypothetical protein
MGEALELHWLREYAFEGGSLLHPQELLSVRRVWVMRKAMIKNLPQDGVSSCTTKNPFVGTLLSLSFSWDDNHCL